MEGLTVVLLGVAAAVVYGVLHDQVTARVCVEYFTIGHPDIFGTADPTLLGLGWGVWATWWVGLALGLLLVPAARAGSLPKVSAGELLRPVGVMMAGVAVLALVAGILGYVLAEAGAVFLIGSLAKRVPAEKHSLYLADLWAHSASYLFGFLGGVGLAVWTLRRRWRNYASSKPLPTETPHGPAADRRPG